MTRAITLSLKALAIFFGAIVLGCSAERLAEPTANSAATASPPASEEDAEVNEAMAKLAPADRALAETQKICPVSDQSLGSMRTPIKVEVDGRNVFVCCEGCVDELKSNCDEYASKLDKS